MAQNQDRKHAITRRILFATCLLLLLLIETEAVHAQAPQRIVLTRVKPDYPSLAARMHISGSVLVLVSVQPDGSVSRVHASSGHAFLQGPAEQAVRQWKFTKAPQSSETTVEVLFAEVPHS